MSVEALRSFLTLEGDELATARTECDRRLWTLRHKKRREFDPDDVEEIADIWAELTIIMYGSLKGPNIEFAIYKPTKEWPLNLRLLDGNKVTSLK